MQPVNDEDLILFYYGELDAHAAETLRMRLAAEPDLAARFAALATDLDGAPEPAVPERDDFYGRRMWARVDAALDTAPSNGFGLLRSLLPAGFRYAGGLLVIGMVAIVAFQLGRHAPPAETVIATVTGEPSGSQQAQLLEASLVRHFDEADRLLTEIANNQSGEVNIEAEKEWAKVLLVANRLYRFAAIQAGQHRIAMLLGEMEPVLIELANGAGQLTPAEYRGLRQSISDRNLLFKVRSTNIALQPQSAQL